MPEIIIDKDRLKRNKKQEPEKKLQKPPEVSMGSIDKIVDVLVNATREKSREFTNIDRMQGRLFPIIDMINAGRKYIIEIATFRQDAKNYAMVFEKNMPEPPDLLDEWLYRTTQWSKSVGGINQGKMSDLALAQIETMAQKDEGMPGGSDAFRDQQ